MCTNICTHFKAISFNLLADFQRKIPTCFACVVSLDYKNLCKSFSFETLAINVLLNFNLVKSHPFLCSIQYWRIKYVKKNWVLFLFLLLFGLHKMSALFLCILGCVFCFVVELIGCVKLAGVLKTMKQLMN